MTVDMFRDEMQHAQLFGKPVLATDQPIPRETVPDGGVVSYAYDLLDRQTGMTDARGNTWTYAYDGEGRLVSTKDPLKFNTSKTYDAYRPAGPRDRCQRQCAHCHG